MSELRAKRGAARSDGKHTSSIVNGLSAGIVASAVIWILGFSFQSSSAVVVLALCAIGLKYVVATVLVCMRGWRSFAIGMFLSLPIGAVIFFGVCGFAMSRV